MIDISRINLGELDNENLERVKLMLDINKIQQDIEATRQSITESQQNMRLNQERHQSDLEQIRQSITDSQESIRLNRERHQCALEQIRATVDQMCIENDKYRAEAKKIEKEAKLYPFVTLGSAMIGGLVVFLLTKLFP